MKKTLLALAFIMTLAYAVHLVSREAPGRSGGFESMAEGTPTFMAFDELLPIGSPAPGFSLKTPKGEEVSLASLRGKTVVLEFGART